MSARNVNWKRRIIDAVRRETIDGRPFSRYTLFAGGTTTRHDLKIAARLLRGRGALIIGPEIAQYEDAFAGFLGVKNAISFGAGRVAFYAILKAMGIGTDDDVLVLGYTCVVVPNAVLFAGARPVYVDVDRQTLGIDPTSLESRITPQTRAIVVQHTLGIPSDMGTIMQLARKHNLKVIEDCAHSIGSTYEGRMVGTFGDAAFFSSELNKCISTGAGGVATTDDEGMGKALREFQQTCSFPSKAFVRRTILKFISVGVFFNFPLSGVGRGVHSGMKLLLGFPSSLSPQEQRGLRPNGFKMRLSNAQAALGLSQIQQLPQIIAHRRKIARIYEDELARVGWRPIFLTQTAKTQVVFLRYPIWVNDNRAVTSQKRLALQVGDWFDSPVYLCDESSLETVHYEMGDCRVAEDATRHIINLPTHPKVACTAAHAVIREVVRHYSISV